MPVLSDRDIKERLKRGDLVIEPLDNVEKIQGACVDLSLGTEFRIFKYTEEAMIDSKNPKEYTEFVNKKDGNHLIIHPGEFILGITKERIKVPDDMVAYVDGRSSIGRLGLTAHITSGWVDPGFSGKLVLEISNLGRMPVTLYPGMKICKILFLKLTSPSETPYHRRSDAKYKNQSTIEQSRIHQDK